MLSFHLRAKTLVWEVGDPVWGISGQKEKDGLGVMQIWVQILFLVL